jgi:hypothetical protein
MDFSKAFDKVSHARLLYKLERYGVSPPVCGWIKSFLSGRTQQVVIDGEASDSVPVTSGVPQGTVLGPSLFLAFINDMPSYTTHSTVRLFADDTIVYLTVSTIDDCIKLQENLTNLAKWEQDWLMEFHPDKCNVLRITKKKSTTNHDYILHGHILKPVPDTKYLGLTISDDLSWTKHIDKTSAKGNQKLGFLKRNLKIKNQDLKAQAYKTLVRPTLEYSSTVWDPYTARSADSLEMVQRRSARWVMNDYFRTSSVTTMLQSLNWRLLALRRADARLTMLYKIKLELVLINPASYFRLQRNNFNIQPIHSRTAYYANSFFPRTISNWNELPLDVKAAPTLGSFKTQVSTIDHALPY